MQSSDKDFQAGCKVKNAKYVMQAGPTGTVHSVSEQGSQAGYTGAGNAAHF